LADRSAGCSAQREVVAAAGVLHDQDDRRGNGGCEHAGGRNPPDASWSLALTRRVAEHPVDATEQEQLLLALGTTAHMVQELVIVSVVEQVGQPLPRFLVRHGDSSLSKVASRLRPRRFQLLTEPRGACSRAAIARSVKSR